MQDQVLIHRLFDRAAPRYRITIAPVLDPLTADFVAYVGPRRDDNALDIGTGTGQAARQLAPWVRQVTGLDMSGRSLRVAGYFPTDARIHYVQADLHRAPFPRAIFSLVVASFGLNMTDPDHSLPALRRLVAPGGRLVIQEWGAAHPFDRALEEILARHAVDTPELDDLRAALDDFAPRWSGQMQDADDYRERLGELGFRVEEAVECAPVAVRLSFLGAYLPCFLAWPPRQDEFEAMPPESRAAFYADCRALMAQVAAPDGAVIWQPSLFRVRAVYRA